MNRDCDRVRFHTVEELAVTMRDQCIPKALAIVIDRLTVGVPCLRSLPPVPMRRGSREAFLGRLRTEWSESWRAMWPRVTGRRSWCRYLVGHPGNAVPNISVRMVLAAVGIPSGVSDAWSRSGPSGRFWEGFAGEAAGGAWTAIRAIA